VVRNVDHWNRVASRLVIAASLVTVLTGLTGSLACGREVAGGSPRIALHPATADRPAFIDVAGLTPGELSSVRTADFGIDQWQSLLTVTVGGDAAPDSPPPVRGRYAVNESAVVFTPLYPFDPGRAYRVTFDPAHLPHPRNTAAVTAVVHLPALASAPETTVTAVHPASEVLPENTLRLYIEFSAPMGSGGALDHVRLTDEGGHVVADPFLPVQADFWNADHTRYTLFFDPGRVKQGILPNEQVGRPLRAGRRYTLEISSDWRDARGQTLKAPYEHRFRVGRADLGPLVPAAWRIVSPKAGSVDPLVVIFPKPLDHGLLGRALSVELGGRLLEGESSVEADDTRWLWRPRTSWEPGAYQLVVLAVLEDPAGNRIGRAFEVDMARARAEAAPDAYRLAFKVAEFGS
jgi:hypothetical protein